MTSGSKNLNLVAFADDEASFDFVDIENNSPPLNLRGGAGDGDETNESRDDFTDSDEDTAVDDDAETGGDDGEDDAPVEEEDGAEIKKTGVVGKEADGEDEDKKGRRRKLLVLLALLLLVGVIVGLAAGLSGGDDTGPPEAKLNTSEPTEAPSPSPEVEPTPIPTPEPTDSPTTTPPTLDPDFSTTSCSELQDDNNPIQQVKPGNPFKGNFEKPDGSLGCADTYAGPEANAPNRNPWTASLGRKDCVEHNWADGKAVCETVGSRRCTADELTGGAGQGSGCNGDNVLVFSRTDCEEGGEAGKIMVNLGIGDGVTFSVCETDLSVESVTRCCADFF